MKKKMKAILSLALAFVLTIGSVNAAGLFTKSVDKVNAAELTPITWSDFGVTNGTSYASDTLKTYTGDTLNNTAFTGDVSIPSGSGLRYAVPSSWYGLTIQESNGKLLITGKGAVQVNGTTETAFACEAKDYGLETFTDTRFTLRIELYNLDSDNLNANVKIYINGKQVGGEISLQGSDVHENYNLGKGIGFAQNGLTGGITLYNTKPALKEITWKDFGVTNGTSYASDTLKTYTGDTLNNTAFTGDVSIPSGSGLRYAVPSSWYGLTIQESNGKLLITGKGAVQVNGTTETAFACEAKDYGLETFTDTRFTLRIELYNLDSNNLNASINIFINGMQVGKEMKLQGSNVHENYNLGKGIGFAQNGLTGGITLYNTKPTLKEITWKDFGVTNGTSYASDTLKTYTGDTLNNTAFTGDVSIPSGSGLRYAVPSSWYGLTIQESNGKLLITGKGAVQVNGTTETAFICEAKDYGLETFTDTRFTLRIELYNLDSDNLNANVKIYINGKQVGGEISLQGSDVHENYNLGKGIGFAQNGLIGGITLYNTKPTLKEITWKNFTRGGVALANGQTIAQDMLYTYSETTLNNTAFTGDVLIPESGGFRYAVVTSHHGLTFQVSEGKLIIKGSQAFKVGAEITGSAQAFVLEPQNYELESFADTRFTIRIELYDLEEDNLSALMNVYVNEIEVGTGIALQGDISHIAFSLGNNIGFGENGLQAGCTVYEVMKKIPVPTDLTSLSWEEFGYTGGITTTESVKRAASHLANLNGTLFSGDVMMEGGREIRYAENADTNADTSADTSAGGVSVKVNTDGTLTASVVNNGTAVKSYTVSGVYYGVNTFINTKFNLKIAVMEENQIGVWVNDIIVGDLFATEAKNLTLGTTLYMVNANITPISSRTTVPTGLKGISFDDWSANDKVSVDGKLENGELCGKAENVESLIGTSLYEVVKFVDTEGTVGKHMFVYGGATSNGWLGIRIYLENEKMQITSYVKVGENYVSHGEFTIDPQTAGVGDSFKDTEFSWQIDTVQVGKHILLYMSFDGQLYNNAPFVFYDFADDISNEMHYTSYEGEDAAEKAPHCWTVLGPATKTLTTLYHDLDKGEYTVPTGTTKFYTKLSNGEWKETDMLTRISAKGDYKVEFNDGVSNYIQEVVCYHYQGDVDVTVLVRALKMKENQTDSSWFDYEKRLCDKNYDDKVDAGDVKTIKEMLLGTYKEETEMKISGFFSPTASLVKDETYATIKSTGVNHIIETNVSYTDDALTRYRTYQELSYAQKYGMTVTVKDGRLTAIGESNGTATADDVKRYVANYKDYQSFEGLFIIDEPKSKSYPNTQEWKNDVDHRIERYASVAQAIHEAGYKGWSNAFGGNNDLFSDKYNFDTKCYMKYGYYSYLGKLVDTYKLDFVSFTYYPFWDEYSANSGVEKAQNYFTNLAMAKDIANKKNISFRNFVQAGEGFEKAPIENFTEAQFKWNANINLAFGTSALEYFPLVHPASLKNYSDDSCASGLLDGEGHLTKFGEWATRVNKQAAAVDEILLHATNEGYMSTGGYAESVATNTVKSVSMKKGLTTSETFKNTIHTSYNAATVTSDDDTYGAFTGCFKITSGEYAGKSAMYIVNYNDTATNNITVTFGSSKEVTTIYQGVKTTQTGNSYTTSLAAGDAVLVVY